MIKKNQNEDAIDNFSRVNSRRSFLTSAAVTGLSFATLGVAKTAKGGALFQQEPHKMPNQPEADSGHDYPMAKPNAQNEKEFRVSVLGPATLSLITSEIAVDKATNADAIEFANFELREAIGVTTILKKLNTPKPAMDDNAKATLAKIKSAAKGKEFDKAYISAQLANHEYLRDLAEGYLKNSEGKMDVNEMHGQHLAMLALATFKEHVVHTKKILKALG